jgi:glycosyltransferase involved in cell wall biosynthesis
MSKDIFVVIPAYNEAKVIASALQKVIDRGYSVVVVDDGSKDDTWSILQGLNVYSLRHPLNLGQGAALQTGMTFALRQGAEFVVHFDADEQHKVEDIEVLLEPVRSGEADVALGSRFLRKEDSRAVPPTRRIVLRCAVVVNGFMTGMWLTDSHNGLRALSRQAAAKIRLRENRFAHASEILTQIRRHKLKVVERPTAIVYSEYSMAKGQSAWNGIRIVMDVLLRRIFR